MIAGASSSSLHDAGAALVRPAAARGPSSRALLLLGRLRHRPLVLQLQRRQLVLRRAVRGALLFRARVAHRQHRGAGRIIKQRCASIPRAPRTITSRIAGRFAGSAAQHAVMSSLKYNKKQRNAAKQPEQLSAIPSTPHSAANSRSATQRGRRRSSAAAHDATRTHLSSGGKWASPPTGNSARLPLAASAAHLGGVYSHRWPRSTR